MVDNMHDKILRLYKRTKWNEKNQLSKMNSFVGFNNRLTQQNNESIHLKADLQNISKLKLKQKQKEREYLICGELKGEEGDNRLEEICKDKMAGVFQN